MRIPLIDFDEYIWFKAYTFRRGNQLNLQYCVNTHDNGLIITNDPLKTTEMICKGEAGYMAYMAIEGIESEVDLTEDDIPYEIVHVFDLSEVATVALGRSIARVKNHAIDVTEEYWLSGLWIIADSEIGRDVLQAISDKDREAIEFLVRMGVNTDDYDLKLYYFAPEVTKVTRV